MKSFRLLLVIACVAAVSTVFNLGCSIPRPPTRPATPTAIVPATSTPAPPQIVVRSPEPSNALEAQIEAVYDLGAPAVVNITSRAYTYDLFSQAIPQEGTGSGFLYDAQGHVVTNYHVVANADSVSVALASGQVYAATVVGSDPSTDLAVLKIEAETLPGPLALGDSEELRVGQFVVAIGNPFGLEQTLTVGVISSLGRVIQSPDGRFIGEAIQTDAAINPGNSGGPLLDLMGRVIGVNSQIISSSGASAGIGFAVSANTVRRVVPQLISQGRYPHPWLGVRLFDLTPERTEVLRNAGATIAVDTGVMIVEVVPDSPAARAGLRSGDRFVTIGNARIPVGGDIITAINGEPLESLRELTIYLDANTQVGQVAEVTVVRDGREEIVPVTLEERPQQS